MGTITRNFANNLTTSGLLKPDAFNNDSFDNVTAVPSGSVETGAMQFISSATASSSASIEFTSGIDSTYKEYVFYFVNIHPQTDLTEFSFNFSTDGGSNYNVAKTSTFIETYHLENDSNAGIGYGSSHDLAQGTGLQRMTTNQGNASDESASGFLHLFNPSSTTFVKHYISNMSSVYYLEYLQQDLCAGYGNTTSAINAIKFQFETGNIDSGQILLFGIN
jgi:hypothetical protein